MSVKTKFTKPRRDRFYIVDYRKLNKPVLMKYDFKTQDLAYQAIVNNLGNDIQRYNIISGLDALRHKIKFNTRRDVERIWPDRKYNYPEAESLTPAQKKNFRNKQNQRAYLERKKKKHEHFTEKNPSYIEANSRWRNLRNSRRRRRHREREHTTESR